MVSSQEDDDNVKINFSVALYLATYISVKHLNSELLNMFKFNRDDNFIKFAELIKQDEP